MNRGVNFISAQDEHFWRISDSAREERLDAASPSYYIHYLSGCTIKSGTRSMLHNMPPLPSFSPSS